MGCCGETGKNAINTNPVPKNIDCCREQKTPFTKYSLLNAGISVIRHYLDPSYNAFSSEEIKEARLKSCEECENLTIFFGKKQCKICKCFVEPKASLIDQKCPYPTGSKW